MMTIIQIMVIQIMIIKCKNDIKFRHELKYRLGKADDYVLNQRLCKLFLHDKNSGKNGCYRVNSLYFDTPYDTALRQKIDGVNCREKFRIRYYNNDLSFIRLEKKFKQNNLCKKYSAKLNVEQVENILKGKIVFLIYSEEPFLNELYSKMKGQMLSPKVIVSYDREAFVYQPGNTRITIDRNLHTGLNSLDFLNLNICQADVSEQISILEIKYDEFLPEIVELAVQNLNSRITALSKYAVCRKYE